MELDFIRWLRQHVPPDSRLPLGLRDDAAVMSLTAGRDIVVTTDLVSDGVDFRLDRDAPRRIGRKAFAVNLSDLAAMAASAEAAVVAIALPRFLPPGQTALKLASALYEGLLPLAKEFDVAIAGGDTNMHDGPLVICTTAFGQTTDRGPLSRGGGRPGDWLLVTGELGGSILGHHFDFTPRVREAVLLHQRYELHAAMDLSDGLGLDLSRLATESQCGAVVQLDQVPISKAAHELSAQHEMGRSALEHALSDGEDFELLLAAPEESARAMLRDQPLDCGLTHIGELITEGGLWQQTANSQRERMEPKGWTH